VNANGGQTAVNMAQKRRPQIKPRGYQGNTLVFLDDWPDLCTNERERSKRSVSLLKNFMIEFNTVDARKRA
jgi:hypothetical protein